MNLHPTLNSLESALRFRSAKQVVQEVALEITQLAPQLARWDNTELDFNPNPNETVAMDARFERNSVSYPAAELVQSQDGFEVVNFKAQRADGTAISFGWEPCQGNDKCARFEVVSADKRSVVLLEPGTGLLVSFDEQPFRV